MQKSILKKAKIVFGEVLTVRCVQGPTKSALNSAPDGALMVGPNGQSVLSGFVPSSELETGECEQRLMGILREKGFSCGKFVRVPGDYYDRSLEQRMDLVGAPSTDHLCKSMVMVNTRATSEVEKYYLIILQVRYIHWHINSQRLCTCLHGKMNHMGLDC